MFLRKMNSKGNFIAEIAGGGALLILTAIMMYIIGVTQNVGGQGAAANVTFNLVRETAIPLVLLITILTIVLASVFVLRSRAGGQ